MKRIFCVACDLNPTAEFYNDNRALDYGLHLLQTSLRNHYKNLLDFIDLPYPSFHWVSLMNRISHFQQNSLISSESMYIQDQEKHSYELKYEQMNMCQRQVFDQITSSIDNNSVVKSIHNKSFTIIQ